MLKQLVLVALAAGLFGQVHASPQNDFDLPFPGGAQALEASAVLAEPDGPSDLAKDPVFGPSGRRTFGGISVAGMKRVSETVRVVPWVERVPNGGSTILRHVGYYVIGKQIDSDGERWRAWITRVNLSSTMDSTFGINGYLFTELQNDIADAVVVDHKAYFLTSTYRLSSFANVTRVICIDLTTAAGDACFDTAADYQNWGISPISNRRAAYGQRLLYDGRHGLYVAARIKTSGIGDQIGITKLDLADASRDKSFADNGYFVGLPSWAAASDVVAAVDALAMTPAGVPGTIRLYVGGRASRSASQTDGYILGLDPVTGNIAPGWNWGSRAYAYEDDNNALGNDAVTALAVLRNGKLAYAGWSASFASGVSPLIMGRLNTDGSYDNTFCAGNPYRGATACRVDEVGPDQPASLPVGLAERRQNRDLLVAMRRQDTSSASTVDRYVHQELRQYSASGNTLHAKASVFISANGGQTPWCPAHGVWMGGTGWWDDDLGTGVGEEVVAMIGDWRFMPDSQSGTLAHFVTTDSIFADQFGGGFGD